jgi:hypothetical protein
MQDISNCRNIRSNRDINEPSADRPVLSAMR